MTQYGNLGGTSGVAAFDIGPAHITVLFRCGKEYLYDYSSNGKTNVESMKSLAQSGKGLNTFMNKSLNGKFARRLR